LIVAWVGGGCATPLAQRVTDPVGPGGDHGVADRGEGRLRVDTATEARREGGYLNWVPTSYTLYTRSGEKVRSVVNHIGDGESPAVIMLPSGHYRVVAQAAGFGLVTVPVVVMANRLTEVFLGRNGMPFGKEQPEDKVARLAPGERVIGWLAPPDPAAGR
jgi:hypothetical protein